MFVYCYTHVGRPFQTVARLVGERPDRLLGGSVDETYQRGGALRLRLQVDGALPLSKEVLIRAGEPYQAPDHVILPITVMSAGATGFFPRLEAELEVAPIGPEVTQLTLEGTYRPPLGSIGGLVDKAVLHRFAEAAVKDLLDQIGCRAANATVPA